MFLVLPCPLSTIYTGFGTLNLSKSETRIYEDQACLACLNYLFLIKVLFYFEVVGKTWTKGQKSEKKIW